MDKDITSQAVSFDPVLCPPGIPEPLVFRDGRPYLRIKADHAYSVSCLIGLDRYDFENKEEYWELRFPNKDGMTYIQLYVDGEEMLYPYLPIAYGCSRPYNAVVMPEEDDFYRLKDVPHGAVRREWFRSSVTSDWASCMVYTPPGYDEETDRKYPVLYLQHGHGENETGWVYSGKVNWILDNMIDAGEAKPFIVVMNAGMVQKKREDGNRVIDHTLLPDIIVKDVIPFIEGKYRIIGDRDNRAMAGLSMGSMHTSITTMTHPELFSRIGLFSGFLRDLIAGDPEMDPISRKPSDNGHLKALDDPEKFAEDYKVFFRGIGDSDHLIRFFLEDDEILKEKGVSCIRKMYKGGHDWNVWRRCIRDFAGIVF